MRACIFENPYGISLMPDNQIQPRGLFAAIFDAIVIINKLNFDAFGFPCLHIVEGYERNKLA